MEIVSATVYPYARSIYATVGDVLMVVTALTGVITWWRARRPLVASAPETDEEE
jgi:uncharacterized iron-regulated membrane protein